MPADNLLSPLLMQSLAAAAVAAPSADNHQVVRLRVAGDGMLQLRATSAFAAAGGHRRVLGWLSTGAVLENLQLRAQRLGLQLDEQPPSSADAGDPRHLLWLRAQPAVPGAAGDAALEAEIERRHSNRRLRFAGPPLPLDAQQQLDADAAARGQARLLWLDSAPRRRAALQLIRDAESERFRDRELHRELFESIRFDLGWRQAATEGLAPATLELPAPERPSFALLRHWPLQRAANLLGAHRFIGWRAADLPCRLAPHLLVIAADAAGGAADKAALQAGRALQRVWLRSSALGLALQVFAASPLYALAGASPLPAEAQRRLHDGWHALCGDAAVAHIVCRLGHAAPPRVRAGRPAPESLLER